MVLDQIARKHHLRIRYPCDDIPGGMACAKLHQAHLAFSKIDRHLAFERERWPGETRNALRILEQARKAAILGIPVLLAALFDQSIGLL